jgi:hypothetical protein
MDPRRIHGIRSGSHGTVGAGGTVGTVSTVGTLVRVVAPHFVAGLIVEGDRCVRAAPILRWAVGKRAAELRAAFARKGWRASVVPSVLAVLEVPTVPVVRSAP